MRSLFLLFLLFTGASADGLADWDTFSSFHCHAGSQTFDFPLQVTQFNPPFPPVDSPMGRMCLLRNVCMLANSNTMHYYADLAVEGAAPNTTHMEMFEGVFNGFVNVVWGRPQYKPKVVWGPRPALAFEPDRLYLLDELSDPSNYAHLLVDTLLPTFGVAQVYGEDVSNVQLLETVNCTSWHNPNAIVPGLNEPASKVCERNLGVWTPLLLHHPMLLPPFNRDMCFRRLVVGQAGTLSLAGEFARGALTRAARRRLYESLGLDPIARPQVHHVVVLVKKFIQRAVDVEDICGSVHAWTKAWPELKVTCITPANLTPVQQFEILSTASVVVSEHGSTTYACMFQVPGSALLIVAPVSKGEFKWAKEPQVMLYLTDLFTVYLDDGRIAAGKAPAVLQFVLHRAGETLGLAALPQVIAPQPENA